MARNPVLRHAVTHLNAYSCQANKLGDSDLPFRQLTWAEGLAKVKKGEAEWEYGRDGHIKGIRFKERQRAIPQTVCSLTMVQQEAQSAGSLAPPNVLAQYNDAIPGGAERIMAMAERQSQHREALEKRVVDGNVASQTRDSYFAFILCFVTFVGGFYLLLEGKSVTGLSAIIAAVASSRLAAT